MARAMRAILAAWASTATLTGRRARMPRCQRVARSLRVRAAHITVLAPRAKSLLSRVSPWRLIPVSRRLPALAYWRGVSPHQRQKSRATEPPAVADGADDGMGGEAERSDEAILSVRHSHSARRSAGRGPGPGCGGTVTI